MISHKKDEPNIIELEKLAVLKLVLQCEIIEHHQLYNQPFKKKYIYEAGIVFIFSCMSLWLVIESSDTQITSLIYVETQVQLFTLHCVFVFLHKLYRII